MIVVLVSIILALWSCSTSKNVETTVYPEYKTHSYQVLENYILDVVSESDFWEESDAIDFIDYEEYTPEWMLDVIVAYTQWYTNQNQ